ncbi:MAG: cation transporter [Actinomycetota bacterium]
MTTADEQIIDFTVDGMTCGSCAARVQRALNKRDDVVEAEVNDATGRARLELAPGADLEDVSATVVKAGYTPIDLDRAATSAPPSTAASSRAAGLRFEGRSDERALRRRRTTVRAGRCVALGPRRRRAAELAVADAHRGAGGGVHGLDHVLPRRRDGDDVPPPYPRTRRRPRGRPHMTTTHVLNVPEMTCDHCKAAIESEVTSVDGVERVDVDLDAKIVTVAGGALEAVVAAIDEAGFDVAS